MGSTGQNDVPNGNQTQYLHRRLGGSEPKDFMGFGFYVKSDETSVRMVAVITASLKTWDEQPLVQNKGR